MMHPSCTLPEASITLPHHEACDRPRAKRSRPCPPARGRDPDPGDLLIALAHAAHPLIPAALYELGVDSAALPAAIERARAEVADAYRELPQRILEVTQAKERAIEARESEQADRLREQERDLTPRQRVREDAVLLPEVLTEIRRSLHIQDQRDGQPPDPS